MKKRHLFYLGLFLFLLNTTAKAQTSTTGANYIFTAVPFLTISPDARAGSMGDVGAATTPDANSMHYNPAKFAMVDGASAVSFSFTPWLRDLVDDMNLAYLSGYYRLDKNQVLAGSLRYFSLGQITFLQNANDIPITQSPNEWALSFAYSRRLSEHLSGAIALRYIRSDLTNSYSEGVETQAGNAFAADISVYSQKNITIANTNAIWSWGVNISNIGSKISYTSADDEAEFIPTNLRLGTACQFELDKYNSFTIALDANKLLVPTPNNGALQNDNGVIVGGETSNQSVMGGIFSSFSDAPGGFSEEFNEISWSLGVEYWYQQQFALRAGYFYEHQNKGNRKYFTAGLGVKLNMFDLDFSYLIATTQNNPLKNTLRFGITARLDKIGRKTNKE